MATAVISEIRDGGGEAQANRPHHTGDDTDEFGNPSRGENYQQDFQAPFYPSVNLEKSPPRNSWAVVTPPPNFADDHNQIDRSDAHAMEHVVDASGDVEAETETVVAAKESFNLDSFQPEFQGGFMPIIAPAEMTPPAAAAAAVQPVKLVAKHADDSIEALVYDDDNVSEVDDAGGDDVDDEESNESTTIVS